MNRYIQRLLDSENTGVQRVQRLSLRRIVIFLLPLFCASIASGQPWAGRAAPDFVLPSLDGGDVSMEQLRGKPIVLNFWATWCPPCRAEMPTLTALQSKYEGELIVVGVNSEEDPQKVKEYVDDHQLTWTILLDEAGDLNEDYDLDSLPITVFVRSDGQVVRRHSGLLTEDDAELFAGYAMKGEVYRPPAGSFETELSSLAEEAELEINSIDSEVATFEFEGSTYTQTLYVRHYSEEGAPFAEMLLEFSVPSFDVRELLAANELSFARYLKLNHAYRVGAWAIDGDRVVFIENVVGRDLDADKLMDVALKMVHIVDDFEGELAQALE